ncbi:hypothetical protein QUQ16_000189 [Escherichia coli]|nr:hypothetical protein [Escherichia coli]
MVNDIVNSNTGNYDLTPSQAAQGYQYYQDAQNIQGLGMSPVIPSTENVSLESQRVKAANAMKQAKESGGLPFSPPSNTTMFMDMLGGLLIGYAAMRLLGGNSKESIAIGLLSAGGNHDADRAEQQRFQVVKDIYSKGGYTEDALYKFMKTGDDKALQSEQKESHEDNLEDKREAQQLKLEGMREAQQSSLESQRENNQYKLEGMRENHANQLEGMREGAALQRAQLMNGKSNIDNSPSSQFHLVDGTPVSVVGKPIKQGSNVLFHVVLPNGNEQIVNSDALQSTATPQQANQHKSIDNTLDDLINANASDLGSFVNKTGGTNKPGMLSEYITRFDDNSRKYYEESQQIQGNRLLKNVADAKAAGASGINTKAEMDAYNNNLPEIDFSSVAAFKESLAKYKAYVDGGYMYTSDYQKASNGSSSSSTNTNKTVDFSSLK